MYRLKLYFVLKVTTDRVSMKLHQRNSDVELKYVSICFFHQCFILKMENLLSWKTLENAHSAIYSFQFHHYLIQVISHWCVPLKWQTEEKIERDRKQRVSNLSWFGIDAVSRSVVDVHATKPWVCIWSTYCNIWETHRKNIKQTKNN